MDRCTTAAFMLRVTTASVLTRTTKILDTLPMRLAVPVVVAILVEETEEEEVVVVAKKTV
jgi:hypothetical protein